MRLSVLASVCFLNAIFMRKKSLILFGINLALLITVILLACYFLRLNIRRGHGVLVMIGWLSFCPARAAIGVGGKVWELEEGNGKG